MPESARVVGESENPATVWLRILARHALGFPAKFELIDGMNSNYSSMHCALNANKLLY